MINSASFIDWLAAAGIRNYVGVPDSLLKSLSLSLASHPMVENHVVSANEGAAVGFAVGVYLESSQPAAVYLQNSGLGNAVNPLTALAHREVYGTPMVLIIGWRGEPGCPDEPQHMVTGRITRELLNLVGAPFVVLDQSEDVAQQQVEEIFGVMEASPGPVAIIVQAGTFDQISATGNARTEFTMTREQALAAVLAVIPPGDRVIVTTGMLGREFWDIRRASGGSAEYDFLVVGGMGHAIAIAHGVAAANPDATVWCLDGDGSLLMHLGSLAIVGDDQPRNLKHVLFNNYSHDSVGGQATAAGSVNFESLCRSLRYTWAGSTAENGKISQIISHLSEVKGPAMVELRISKGARSSLGRPPAGVFRPATSFPRENK